MRMTIDMPPVSECAVSDCVYNVGNNCHARAITIGDGVHPGCDTFFSASRHTGARGPRAGVGACKVSGCMHNEEYECMADAITVGYKAKAIHCLTCRM